MSKPKMYGQKTGYVPNAKADMRHHKKIYQRGREKPMIRSQNEAQAIRADKTTKILPKGAGSDGNHLLQRLCGT